MIAAALRGRREKAVKQASEEGAAEPRATEMDLYPIIVHGNFRNTPDNPWAAEQLIQHLKEIPLLMDFFFSCLVALFF